MFHQFVTPVTTKLSFTNSDPQKSDSPISTISFYSNTPTFENVPCSTLPISDSLDDNLLKPSIYFDYPTSPDSYVERTFDHNQDTYHLNDISVPTCSSEHISTTYNYSQDFSPNSPEYCPKSPVYVTKPHDVSQKFSIDSPVYYPSSPTTPTNFSKLHNYSINSSQYCQITPVYLTKDLDTSNEVINNSSDFYTLSPISISTVYESKRSTLSEKKRNSIEQSTLIGKIKLNKFYNDEELEDKENNSLEDSFNLNSESIDIDESISDFIQSDSDATIDENQTMTSHSLNESSSTRGRIRRSTRLAAKPPLNYRV
ncbi:hypothetical protein C1645_763528 [Glomus cerebriforme]|uniref:Uncharacterized protein n=1 Tax=Glomus cerebriforme TaxID=658196 RepID=A0A397TDG4_9GLOM|nr:hypothetical protein C1645_763528 [Glomus cerebriforme]